MTFFHHLDDLAEHKPAQGFTGKLIHSENMTVVNWSIESGSAFPEHSHPHEQIGYVVKGSFEATLGDETSTIHAGDTYYVPPNLVHGVIALEEGILLDIFTPQREDFLKSQ